MHIAVVPVILAVTPLITVTVTYWVSVALNTAYVVVTAGATVNKESVSSIVPIASESAQL